jgi:hypothetical protein
VEGQAGFIIGVWQLDAAGFDLQRVEAAVAILVDPFADRIARKGGLGLLGPTASVRIDPSVGIVEVVDNDTAEPDEGTSGVTTNSTGS